MAEISSYFHSPVLGEHQLIWENSGLPLSPFKRKQAEINADGTSNGWLFMSHREQQDDLKVPQTLSWTDLRLLMPSNYSALSSATECGKGRFSAALHPFAWCTLHDSNPITVSTELFHASFASEFPTIAKRLETMNQRFQSMAEIADSHTAQEYMALDGILSAALHDGGYLTAVAAAFKVNADRNRYLRSRAQVVAVLRSLDPVTSERKLGKELDLRVKDALGKSIWSLSFSDVLTLVAQIFMQRPAGAS